MNQHEPLKREDYEEPSCLLIDPQTGRSCAASTLPVQRILDKLDAYCGRKEFAAAERHLLYWLEEARISGDKRGAFTLCNEMMGFYRKQDEKDKAVEKVNDALRLMKELGIENTVSGGTCYVNCGTVYDQFGMPKEALSYFEKAEQILDSCGHKDAYKMGSLYNNMALAFSDTEQFDRAERYFQKALDIMAQVENGQLEQAVTCLNLADTAALKTGLEAAEPEISQYLEKARGLLDTETLPKNAYYAFVCEKCAPGFYCYGYPDFGAELEARANEIYQREKQENV